MPHIKQGRRLDTFWLETRRHLGNFGDVGAIIQKQLELNFLLPARSRRSHVPEIVRLINPRGSERQRERHLLPSIVRKPRKGSAVAAEGSAQ